MTRFLGIAIFLVVAAGMAIHAGYQFPPFLSWIGHLPGDLLIKKDKLIIYVPLTSSVLISVVLSFVFSIFSRRER